MELLAPHVPDSLIGESRGLGSSSVEQLGSREDASLDLCHGRVDGDSELMGEGIRRELSLADKAGYLPFSLGSRTSSRLKLVTRGSRREQYLDHGRRLGISELLDASLAGDDVADLWWQVCVFLLLSDLKNKQFVTNIGREKITVSGSNNKPGGRGDEDISTGYGTCRRNTWLQYTRWSARSPVGEGRSGFEPVAGSRCRL